MNTLGERIRLKREEQNMSQDELAKKLGFKSRSSITKIEQGINDMPQSKILECAKILNTSVNYLFGINENTPTKRFIVYHSSNPKENEVIKLIKQTKIPNKELDLLIAMIKSWNFPKKSI